MAPQGKHCLKMDGLFVVGPMNVMLYHQYNKELKAKFVQLAVDMGLIEEQIGKVRNRSKSKHKQRMIYILSHTPFRPTFTWTRV